MSEETRITKGSATIWNDNSGEDWGVIITVAKDVVASSYAHHGKPVKIRAGGDSFSDLVMEPPKGTARRVQLRGGSGIDLQLSQEAFGALLEAFQAYMLEKGMIHEALDLVA